MQIVWIFRDETFEQGGDDVERRDAVDDVRIEILHFRAVAFVQNLEARSFFDVRLSAMTRCGAKKEKNEPQMACHPERRRGISRLPSIFCEVPHIRSG